MKHIYHGKLLFLVTVVNCFTVVPRNYYFQKIPTTLYKIPLGGVLKN